ncbi:hypothetical protein SUGI_0855090 [Cryptomeria japonica]|nr:hypothetical protein SUGI_0855090 [Cryptomeria japonica]
MDSRFGSKIEEDVKYVYLSYNHKSYAISFRGLQTKAGPSNYYNLITALKIGVEELQGITRIEALVLPENVASARVLEKAGFIKKGLLRNYVYLKGSLTDCFLFSFVVASLNQHRVT